MTEEIKVKAIGIVKNGFEEEASIFQWRDAVSEIVIKDEFADALEGIELWRYMLVIFWMNRADPAWQRGALATSRPPRPNPIGTTIVELVSRSGNVLRVKGLDALDKTPILNIAPYKPWSLNRLGRLPCINISK